MRTNHTRWNVSWAVLALAVTLWSAIGFAQAPQPPAEGKTRTVLLVSESGDQVTELAWSSNMTLGAAVLQRANPWEWRLIARLWRGDKSTRYNERALRKDSVMKQPLQPNDVVVIGEVDEKRLRRLEAIPAIARALGIPATASPGEKPKSERQADRILNF